MEQVPERRTRRFVEAGVDPKAEERTAEFERETLEGGHSRTTNDSAVIETAGSPNGEIHIDDYEKALPGHYKLIRMIGRGGMADVFLAQDERLGRSVAIKFLNSEFRRDPDRMRRFNQEARAASALNHPTILTIHDIGENGGVQFIVSEFVEGETLSARIAKGKLPLVEAVRVSMQIASALVASHNAGIVHRDIKPDNIMIRRDGSVKVLDFGLAKESGAVLYDSGGQEARTLEGGSTSPGLILGTPQYMSPEQARGKPLDARTDIFSFGVILFEMVTGKQPFPGNSMVDIIAAVIGKEPRSLEEFIDEPPQLLVRIVGKSLRKNKEERYRTMDHMLSDLRDLQREIAEIPQYGRETKDAEMRPTRNNTVRSILGSSPVKRNAVLLVLIAVPVVALIAWWISSGQTSQNAPVPQGSMRMVPITNWSSGTGELVTAASFSPEAKMVAFAATKTGSTEIWAKPVAGGDPIQVTKNGFYNQYPIWSPNGQDIAFLSSRGGNVGIWRASFTGGEQVQVIGGVGGTARPILWSKTGKIYFQDGSEVFAADERSGEKTRVTNFESKGISPRTIEISNDETKLAYSTKENGVWKVKIADLASSETSNEVASSNEQIEHIAWDPDGNSVIYSSSADGAYQVFRSAIGFPNPVQLSNGNLDFFVQDVSGDGSKILYGSVNETSDIWKIDVDNNSQSAIANDVAAEFWPDVSPDGKSIAYQSVNQADRPFRGSIVVRPDESSAPMVVSQEGFSPVWSPDGKWAAYFRRSDAGIAIWRVRAAGGDAQKLADGAINPPSYTATPYLKMGTANLNWSPDSSSVLYSAKTDGVSNIWQVAADGSKNSVVSANKDSAESFGNPIWTPNGGSIVFASEKSLGGDSRKHLYRLWIVDPKSLDQRVIFETNEQFRFLGFGSGGNDAIIAQRPDPADRTAVPATTRIIARSIESGTERPIRMLESAYFNNIHLSRDGRAIAYVTRKNDGSSLWTAPIVGGAAKQLMTENDPKVLISSLAWSPDGRSIVFGKQTRTNLLSMLSN